MATCKYCGKSAGLFSKVHKECEDKHREGIERMKGLMRRYFDGAKTASEMGAIIRHNRTPYFLIEEDIAECGVERSKTQTNHLPRFRPMVYPKCN